jgi:hypothetical protein
MSQMTPVAVPRLFGSSSISALRLGALVCALATQGTALAQDRSATAAMQSTQRALPVQSAAECTCRALGTNFVVGSEACINNARMRCVMEQNVTSWKRVQDSCPQSSESERAENDGGQKPEGCQKRDKIETQWMGHGDNLLPPKESRY